MGFKQNISKRLSGVFNVLSGKKGLQATLGGYSAVVGASGLATCAGVLAFGTGGLALPLMVGVVGLFNVVNGTNLAINGKKKHDDKIAVAALRKEAERLTNEKAALQNKVNEATKGPQQKTPGA